MKIRTILGATAALVLVAGCADGYYGADYGYYGPDTQFDGYYDGAYGPIYDGYWGTGGAFYYRTGAGGRWRRGGGNHFRQNSAPGFNHIHGVTHGGTRPRH